MQTVGSHIFCGSFNSRLFIYAKCMHFNENFEYSINYLSCIVFSDELTNFNCRQNVTIFYLYYLVFQCEQASSANSDFS